MCSRSAPVCTSPISGVSRSDARCVVLRAMYSRYSHVRGVCGSDVSRIPKPSVYAVRLMTVGLPLASKQLASVMYAVLELCGTTMRPP